jgi:hypothetical protein
VTHVTEIVRTPAGPAPDRRTGNEPSTDTTGVFDPVVRGKSEEAEGC